ncbi:MAG: hypothetical protein NZ807_12845 [Dehalococcoidia bacterium]|nr:hypothetical protein [Dehalococcoidia bacterium]
MSDERKLTEEEREKIQRLLESGTLENIDLALSLIEETSNTYDISKLFTQEIILELICLEDPRVMVRAGSIIMKCSKTWKGFADILVDPLVMTSKVYQSQLLDLNDITSISPAAATELVADDWNISLNGLTNLSAAVAQCLGKTGGNLHFGGLTTLSDKAAKNLSTCGSLSLPVLTTLSDKSAKNLSTCGYLLLALTTLSDKAAKNLSTCGSLSLPGLTTLSDKAAEHLSKQKGKLNLNALKSLTSEKGHLALVKKLCRQEEVLLCGLTSLTDENAVLLAAHDKVVVSAKIESQIKKAASKQRQTARKIASTGKATLTKKQSTKIRKLLRSKDANNIVLAGEILESCDVTPTDVVGVLSSTVISLLINTWDVAVWNSLAPICIPHEIPRQEFTEMARKRFKTISEDSQQAFVVSLWMNATEPLVAIIDDCRFLENLRGYWGYSHFPTKLSDAGVNILSKYEGSLPLGNLVELSDSALEILSNRELAPSGNGFDLDGLTSLSDPAAQTLGVHVGDISLNGLTSLSDAAAKSLGQHSYGLSLDGLTSLSDAAAGSLADHAEYINFSYDLSNLPKLVLVLSDDKAYSSFPGHVALLKKIVAGLYDRCVFNFLSELADSAAKILETVEMGLDLSGLTQLTDAAAGSLSKHKGQLNLSGLAKVSDSAAKSLSKHQGLPTFCYTGYDDDKLDGLDLSGLTTLPNSTIKILAESKGRLNLSGLKQLSDAAAELLSKHDGVLVMNGLTKLSDAAALSLSKHELHLELRGITTISDAAAKSLGENQRRMKGGGAYHKYSSTLHTATGVYIRGGR